jgi:hypothetical protein
MEVTDKHVTVKRQFVDEKPLRFVRSFIQSKFIYEYAFTGHQVQGATVSEPLTIDLSDTMFMTPEWINSVVFRATQWDHITILFDKNRANFFKRLVLAEFARLVDGYKAMDADAGRTLLSGEKYITPQWLYSKIVENGQCDFCHEPLDYNVFDTDHNISADRIYNCLPHTESNCHVTCRHCNISKRK